MVVICEPCRSEAATEATLRAIAAIKSRCESPSLRHMYVHTKPEEKTTMVLNAPNNLYCPSWSTNDLGKGVKIQMGATTKELRMRFPSGEGNNNNFAPCISIKGGGMIQKARDGSLRILGPRGKYGISLDPKHYVMQLLSPPSRCGTKLYGCNSHATFQSTANNNM